MNNEMTLLINGVPQEQKLVIAQGATTAARLEIRHHDSRCANCGESLYMSENIPFHMSADMECPKAATREEQGEDILIAPQEWIALPAKVPAGWITSLDTTVVAAHDCEKVVTTATTLDGKFIITNLIRMPDDTTKVEIITSDGVSRKTTEIAL